MTDPDHGPTTGSTTTDDQDSTGVDQASAGGTAGARSTRPARARGAAIDEASRKAILAAHAEGGTRNAIARSVGVAQSTVSKVVHDSGGSFDRARTRKATEARVEDQRAQRVALAGETLAAGRTILRRLGDAGTPADVAAVLRAVRDAVSAHASLAKVDADTDRREQDASSLDAWLHHLLDGPDAAPAEPEPSGELEP